MRVLLSVGWALLILLFVVSGCEEDKHSRARAADRDPYVFAAEHGNLPVRKYRDEQEHVTCYVLTGTTWAAVGISCLRDERKP